jgi:hypothetical protein
MAPGYDVPDPGIGRDMKQEGDHHDGGVVVVVLFRRVMWTDAPCISCPCLCSCQCWWGDQLIIMIPYLVVVMPLLIFVGEWR